MNTCSVCERIFEDKYFDYEQNKCILHCEKDESNYWYKINQKNEKEWTDSKVNLFWEKINKVISNENYIVEELLQPFKKDEISDSIFAVYEFKEVVFPGRVYTDTSEEQPFYGLISSVNIDFVDCEFMDVFNFGLLSKAKDITFSNCKFFENVIFINMNLNGKFIFEGCEVLSDIKFRNIVFHGITSFIKTKFLKKLYFIHSRFDDLALFNDIEVKELLLENTFFRAESNFLNISANMADRETARIIKNSFEKQNNIIEANRFYALEMKEREKELKFLDNPLEWIVFKMHSISSDHSQDWFLALLWIFIIGFISYLVEKVDMLYYIKYIEWLLIPLVGTITLIKLSDIKEKKKYSVLSLFVYFIILFGLIKDTELDSLAKYISQFLKFGDNISAISLFFKVIIAYLIYQFIVSVRQNTRRK